MPVNVPFITGSRQFSIDLAEPVIYLRGPPSNPTTHVLRGQVVLLLSKPMSATSVVIKLVGKSDSLWPEGIGSRGTKMHHEKTIHEQHIILESWPAQDADKVLSVGLHQWPFEFLLPNRLVETIEDEMAKVFYYVSAVIQRPGMGVANLRCRRDILLLRTLAWSDGALTSNALPSTSITSERHLDCCDAIFSIDKSIVSSGTPFPINFTLAPHIKHVYLESISVMLTEQRVYRLPEYGARRAASNDFRLKLEAVTHLVDQHLVDQHLVPPSDISLSHFRRLLAVKNAHIPLSANPFQYRCIFQVPNCIHLNHSSTFTEIDIRHYLKIRVELSLPDQPERKVIYLETPITILDCRLKEDYATLPTYEEALNDMTLTDATVESQPTGFFICPCYLEYKKKRQITRQEWVAARRRSTGDLSRPPPPYDLEEDQASHTHARLSIIDP